MLKNRELSIQLKKTSPSVAQEEVEEDEDTIEKVKDALIQIIFVTTLAFYGYVAMDTARQVKIVKAMSRRNYTPYNEKR